MSQRRRATELLWIVADLDGRQFSPMNKADLDRLALSGRLDASARVRRQDWTDFRNVAELYQGLASPALHSARREAASPFWAPARGAPPWAPLPDAPALAAPAAPASRWRWSKLALLAVAATGGIAAFGRALGGLMLQPALPRPVLFWLFAAYWLALAALAAGLFDWRWQRETGELLGLHRMLGEQAARWLLLIGGAAVMFAIVCLIGQ